jgi:hypothetical protein
VTAAPTDDDPTTPAAAPPWTRSEVLVTAGLAAALGVALVLLADGPSIWWDEVFSWGLAQEALGTQLRTVPRGAMNGVIHHVLAAGLVPVVGDDLTWLRFPSILAWLAGLPAFHALARRLRPDATALVATAIYALAPLGLRHALEFRMYALAATAAVVSTWLLARFVERPDTGRAVAYGLGAAIALGTHYFVVLTLAVHGLAVLLHPDRRRLLRTGWPAAVPTALALIPLAAVAAHRGGGGIAWIPELSWSGFTDTVFRLLGVTWSGYDGSRLVPALPLLLLLTVGLVRAVASRASDDGDRAWLVRLVTLGALLPVLAAVVISIVVQPVLVDRYLVIVLAPGVLTALAGLDTLLRARRPLDRMAGWALGSLVLVATVPSSVGILTSDALGSEDFRLAGRLVADAWREGDLVVTGDHADGHQARDGFLFHLDEAEVGARTMPIGRLERALAGGTIRPEPARLWVLDRGPERTLDWQAARATAALGGSWELTWEWHENDLSLGLLERRSGPGRDDAPD